MPKFDVILISQWGLGEAREVPGKVQIEAVDAIDALDRLFHAQQDDRKPFPWLSSMSAGDVAVVDGKPWYCRACGWLEITTGEFLSWLRMGREAHDLLRDAFRRRRVKFTPYRRVAFTEEMRDKLAACRPAAIKVSSGSQP